MRTIRGYGKFNDCILGGLPRSGITLLASLLSRNEKIYVTTTSPFVEILYRCFSLWDDPAYHEDFQPEKLREAKIPFLRGMTNAYYQELTDKPIVIDKRRQWQGVANIELFREVYGDYPKILCPIRSIPEIITSWKTLYKKNNTEWSDQHMDARSFHESYEILLEGYKKYPECFHLIQYDDLVDNTEETLGKVYDFMKLERPEYKQEEVKQVEKEGQYTDRIGMHILRPEIKRDNIKPEDVLTKEELEKYSKLDNWY